jgi:toxin YoeB
VSAGIQQIVFTASAWKDYAQWQASDSQGVKRINSLLFAAMRKPFEGIGKPEPLKADLAGFWNRRITREHRLVYAVETDRIVVISCRYHY